MGSPYAGFEWDDRKAKSNLRKHAIAFVDAVFVFFDPLRIESIDDREDDGESRWKTIRLAAEVLIAVVYTVRGLGPQTYASFLRGKPAQMKEDNTIKVKIDPKRLPVPTAAQRKRLKTLADLPDAQIDLSDDPESPGNTIWMRPGTLVPTATKQLITLRLDPEVIQFFKATGTRYQSRINAALREYIKQTT